MNSIDEDARLIGIDEKVWRDFKNMTEQQYLPGFLEAESEARESSIDEETFIRRKQALAKRWFGYYRKCQDQKKKASIIEQYNMIAIQKQRG